MTRDDGARVEGLGPVTRVASVVALGGLLFGYDTGVISGALDAITADFALSPLASGVVVSAILVGAMAGAAGAGRIADRHGRRPVLVAAAGVFGVGAVLAALAPSAPLLTAARVVLGLGIGIASNVVPVFIAEMAPAALRGRLVGLNQLALTAGILLAYVSNAVLADVAHGWRWMFGVAEVPAVLFGVGMWLLPESPRWLARHGRGARARAVLAGLRGRDDVDAELAVMSAPDPGEGERVGWRALLDPSVRPAVVAGVGLQLLAQATGLNTVIYYAPTIFAAAGFGASGALLATVGVGVVNFAMTPVGMVLADRLGRRPLLTAGAVVMTLSLGGLAVTLGTAGTGPVAAALSAGLVFVFIAAVASTVCAVIFTVPSELYPLRLRATGMSASMFANWTMNFLVSLTFLSLIHALETAATFGLYAAICALLAVFSWRVIPETKGRTLEEIEGWYPADRPSRAAP